MLAVKGLAPPKAKKTGTTIVGCIFKVISLYIFFLFFCSNTQYFCFCRMELCWELTQEPPRVLLFATKTVRKFTTLPQTFIAAVLVPLLILKTPQVCENSLSNRLSPFSHSFFSPFFFFFSLKI